MRLIGDYPAAALRLCLLDRPWADTWDYATADLESATARLERLYQAAGRGGGNSPATVAQVTDALCDNLNVPAAIAIAEEAGGAAARSLIAVLGLSE